MDFYWERIAFNVGYDTMDLLVISCQDKGRKRANPGKLTGFLLQENEHLFSPSENPNE
jgi:hypothetical protein